MNKMSLTTSYTKMAESIRVRITNGNPLCGHMFDPFWLLVSTETCPSINDVKNKIVSICRDFTIPSKDSDSDNDDGGVKKPVIEENSCQLWLDGCRLIESEKTEILRENDSITVYITTPRGKTSVHFHNGLSTKSSSRNAHSNSKEIENRLCGDDKNVTRKRKRSYNNDTNSLSYSDIDLQSVESLEVGKGRHSKNKKKKRNPDTEKDLDFETKNGFESIPHKSHKKKKKSKEPELQKQKKKNKNLHDDYFHASLVLDQGQERNSTVDSKGIASKVQELEEELLSCERKIVESRQQSVSQDQHGGGIVPNICKKHEKIKANKKSKKVNEHTLINSVDSVITFKESEAKESLLQAKNQKDKNTSMSVDNEDEVMKAIPVEKRKRRRKKPKSKRALQETPKSVNVEAKPGSSVLNLPWNQQPQNTKVVFDSDSSEEDEGENCNEYSNHTCSFVESDPEKQVITSNGDNICNSEFHVKNFSVDTKNISKPNSGHKVMTEDHKKSPKINCGRMSNKSPGTPEASRKSRRFIMKSTLGILNSIKSSSPLASPGTNHNGSGNETSLVKSPVQQHSPKNKVASDSNKSLIRSTSDYSDSFQSPTCPSVAVGAKDRSKDNNGKSPKWSCGSSEVIQNNSNNNSLSSKPHFQVNFPPSQVVNFTENNIDAKTECPKSKSPALSLKYLCNDNESRPAVGNDIGASFVETSIGGNVDSDAKFNKLLQQRKLSTTSCTVRTSENGVRICSRNSSPRTSFPNQPFADPAKDVLTSKSIIKKNFDGADSPVMPAQTQSPSTSKPTNNESEISLTDFSCTSGSQKDQVEVIPLDVDKCPPLIGQPVVGDILGYKILEMSEDYSPVVSDFKTVKVVSFDGKDSLALEVLGNGAPAPKKSGKFELVYDEEEAEVEAWNDNQKGLMMSCLLSVYEVDESLPRQS